MAAFLRAAATGRNVLVTLAVLAVVISSFWIYLTPAYQAVSGGTTPFDMQFPLSAEMVGIQLALLTPQSLVAYTRFMIVDFIFPPIGAFFTVMLWAWSLNSVAMPRWDGLFAAGAWVVPFLGAVCDWVENVLFYRIVASAPQAFPQTIDLVLTIHDAKLRILALSAAVTAALLLTAATTIIWRRLRTR